MNSKKRSRKSALNKKAFDERQMLKLWRSPVKTTFYFIQEIFHQFSCLIHQLIRYKLILMLIMVIFACIIYLRSLDGPQKEFFSYLESKTLWWSWWIFLGFLSSCGFGSGLHTFVLYLGPFIANVTMSAFVCRTLNFPEPPYPDTIICPKGTSPDDQVTFFDIVRKVQIESILWGFGTALGELPPYYMARGARLSGRLGAEEIEILSRENTSSSSLSSMDASVSSAELSSSEPQKHEPSLYSRGEMLLQKLVMRAGFFGILLCASVPNPLFDLAGMTCGHFLIPFWSFFGATFIGKALIKVHLQQFLVIAVSSEHHINSLVGYIGSIPVIGANLQRPLMDYFQKQKDKLENAYVQPQQSWIQSGITAVVGMIMLIFVISIINAMAQNCHRRQHSEKRSSSRNQNGKIKAQ